MPSETNQNFSLYLKLFFFFGMYFVIYFIIYRILLNYLSEFLLNFFFYSSTFASHKYTKMSCIQNFKLQALLYAKMYFITPVLYTKPSNIRNSLIYKTTLYTMSYIEKFPVCKNFFYIKLSHRKMSQTIHSIHEREYPEYDTKLW